MSKKKISLILNIFIAAAVFISWGMMFFDVESGSLSSSGLSSLKYFTVLSNLLCGAASIIYLCTGRSSAPKWVQTLKFVAAVAVGLTFVVIAFFLGPIYGHASMYRGANLWMHLIVPVAAIVDLCLFDEHEPIRFKTTFIAVIPMLIYGIAYSLNLLINGVGVWPDTNDWYGFMNWGIGGAVIVFVGIAFVTWLIAVLLRRLSSHRETESAVV